MKKRENRLPETPLNEKLLLSLDELQAYLGLGKGKAVELANDAGAVRRSGRRKLFIRAKLDEWCYENDEL